jgi:hypothetical protein
LGCKPGVNVKLVKELLTPDRSGWDQGKLNECFFEVDVADIVKIPVGRAGSDDYIAWNYTKMESSACGRLITSNNASNGKLSQEPERRWMPRSTRDG